MFSPFFFLVLISKFAWPVLPFHKHHRLYIYGCCSLSLLFYVYIAGVRLVYFSLRQKITVLISLHRIYLPLWSGYGKESFLLVPDSGSPLFSLVSMKCLCPSPIYLFFCVIITTLTAKSQKYIHTFVVILAQHNALFFAS